MVRIRPENVSAPNTNCCESVQRRAFPARYRTGVGRKWVVRVESDGHPGTRKFAVPDMNVFWMVTALVVTLLVIAVSFAAALTADARFRRSRRLLAAGRAAGSESGPQVLTAEAVPDGRDWPRVATAAWAICVAASVIAMTFVGVLIIVG